MLNTTPYHTIIPFKIAALRANMKAVSELKTPFLAVSSVLGVFGCSATSTPVWAGYQTNKTTDRRFSRTVDITIIQHSNNYNSAIPPAPPNLKIRDLDGDRDGSAHNRHRQPNSRRWGGEV